MSDLTLNVGEGVGVRHLRVTLFESGWADYKAPLGEVMVMLYLGNCPKGEVRSFDYEAVFRDLGWVRSSDPTTVEG